MIAVLLIAVAISGPLEEENDALREAVDHFKSESTELRLEIEDLHSAISSKDSIILLKSDTISEYRSLVLIKDDTLEARVAQLDAADKLNNILKEAYDREKASKNVGKVERTAWTIALGGALGLAAYGTLKKSQITVNTGP